VFCQPPGLISAARQSSQARSSVAFVLGDADIDRALRNVKLPRSSNPTNPNPMLVQAIDFRREIFYEENVYKKDAGRPS
jgi:hypothetical protein